jgi:predicted unusual protein kinase regulating ubiquinone biosynthesis (AarF/ABC1/UbiB family)
LVLLPARLGRDWQNVQEQFEDLRHRLEEETDYEQEAATLEKARSLFREDDGVVVPRVFRQFSSSRVLSMEYLDGLHIDQFMDRNPTQELRNEVARKVFRAWYRLMYAGRLLYADFHTGNFLVMNDGRLGILDFGFVLPIDDALWDYFRIADRALTTGSRDDRLKAVQAWSWVSQDTSEAERLRLVEEYVDWSWRPRYCGGPFDFSDEADFRHGVDLFAEIVRKRLTRGRPSSPTVCRSQMSWRAILYRLKAQIDVREIAEEEVKAAGWDRSDYAKI